MYYINHYLCTDKRVLKLFIMKRVVRESFLVCGRCGLRVGLRGLSELRVGRVVQVRYVYIKMMCCGAYSFTRFSAN